MRVAGRRCQLATALGERVGAPDWPHGGAPRDARRGGLVVASPRPPRQAAQVSHGPADRQGALREEPLHAGKDRLRVDVPPVCCDQKQPRNDAHLRWL